MGSPPVAFSTLGMFIIDLFEGLDPPVPDQIGGGGTYALIAARMFLDADRIGMIVDRGSDWSQDIQKQLEEYGKQCWLFRDDESRLTTKAKATYNGETRGFQYLSARKRITPDDLAGTRLAAPEFLHFVCAPTRALEIIEQIDSLGWASSTSFVYEPIPDLCIPSELPSLRRVLPRIEFFSPNHEEAGTFFGLQLEPENGQEMEENVKRTRIEELAQRFLDEGAKNTVIIRSGKLGAYLIQRKGTQVTEKGKWVPAYYQSAEKIVDVTGAGNAFLGGLIAGLSQTGRDTEKACLYGSVASSYTIEQYGLPRLDYQGRWNGSDRPEERLLAMEKRVLQS